MERGRNREGRNREGRNREGMRRQSRNPNFKETVSGLANLRVCLAESCIPTTDPAGGVSGRYAAQHKFYIQRVSVWKGKFMSGKVLKFRREVGEVALQKSHI
jgi:hypothetical protein